MPEIHREHRRSLLESWFGAAVARVEGGEALRRALRSQPVPTSPPSIIAIGKAAPAMARAAAHWLESNDLAPAPGVVISNLDAEPPSEAFQMFRGDHPSPGPGSSLAAAGLERLVATLPQHRPVWVLLSGGASSLIAAPRNGLGDQELCEAFRELHRRGLDIREMNAERRKLTRWSGGRLAQALGDRDVTAWVISDVVGNDLATIGSGPLVAESGESGVVHHIIADGATAAEAACQAAERDGFDAILHREPITGDATTAGRQLSAWIRSTIGATTPGAWEMHAWHGETTVSLPIDHGTGGRAQHMALAVAGQLATLATDAVSVLVAGTDGQDGPTDAAGAVVDATTAASISSAGVSVREALLRADSHPALDSAGALFRTGATGTNVADLVLVLLRRP